MIVEQPRAAETDEQLSLADIGRAVRRRWYIALSTLLACMTVGFFAYHAATREYTADTTVEVNTPATSGSGELASIESPLAAADYLDTETAILQSDTLAEATINKLSLLSNPVFLDPPYTGGSADWENNPVVRSRALSTWKNILKVTQVNKTHLVQISVSTRDPRLSRDIANALVDSYISHNYQSHYDVAQQASDYLASQLAKLRQSAAKSQQDLLDYQRRSGLISGDKNGSLLIQQITDLTHSLIQAESERIVAESQYRLATGSTRDVVTALYSDTALQTLNAQRTNLAQQTADDQQRYGPKYPKMVADRQQLALIDQQINDRIASLRTALKKRYDESAQAENAYRAQLDAAKTAAYETSSAAVQLAIKEKEVEAAGDLYQTVSARLQSAGLSAGLAATNIQRLDMAHEPAFPSSPRKAIYFGVSLLAGLVLGLVLAYVLDRIMDRVESESRIESALGVPVLGVLPRVSTDAVLHPGSQGAATNATQNEDAINYLEACRAVRSSIMFSREGGVHSIVITSAGPGEGKSTVAENLSTVFARSDRSVLLIDADLRRPVLARRLGIASPRGLTDILVGMVKPEDVIRPVEGHEGLFLLSAGTISPHAGELLDSQHMTDLLQDLKQRFSMLVIDTPPVVMVTDATVLAKTADQLIVVARAGVTRERDLQEVVRITRRAHLRISGIILNAAKAAGSYYSSRYYYQSRGDEA